MKILLSDLLEREQLKSLWTYLTFWHIRNWFSYLPLRGENTTHGGGRGWWAVGAPAGWAGLVQSCIFSFGAWSSSFYFFSLVDSGVRPRAVPKQWETNHQWIFWNEGTPVEKLIEKSLGRRNKISPLYLLEYLWEARAVSTIRSQWFPPEVD